VKSFYRANVVIEVPVEHLMHTHSTAQAIKEIVSKAIREALRTDVSTYSDASFTDVRIELRD
jgi:hypothetical protein